MPWLAAVAARVPWLAAVAARVPWLAAVALVVALVAAPPASAHGPINPEAGDYLARVVSVAPGVSVRTVDGDLRLWLRRETARTVVVLDYQGIPYLRLRPDGVAVNQRSVMYFLDQTPPVTPPTSLRRDRPPRWKLVSRGDSYEWHDSRLHALAATLAAPGARTLGHWRIPLRIDGRAAAITGALDRTPPPSLAWLWPAVVVLLAIPALRRLRDPRLEHRVAHALAWIALSAATILAVGEGLHGRPGLSTGRLVALALQLAIVAWAAWRLARGQDGPWVSAVIAMLALYRWLAGVAILFRGYVLLALPATLARGAVAACLAASLGLGLLLVLELAEPRARRSPAVVER